MNVITFHKDVIFEFNENKKQILIYIKNEIFFKQDYIKNETYTFLLVILVMSRYGLINIKKVNKDVCL